MQEYIGWSRNGMKTPKDYIIFPLDVPSPDEAIRYVRMLRDHVGLFKVGLELFISQGPAILKRLSEEGAKGIFLDLKLHDIPATVSRAFQAAARHGPAFITVHCDDGEAIRKAAALENPAGTKILAITVLTSVRSNTLSDLGFDRRFNDNMIHLVLLRAMIARNAGCHGVVCSGREVATMKREFGDDLLIVAPGIRPSWGDVPRDDQARIVTPQKAVSDGANYIVVGRPIRDAQDPAAAAQRIAEDIAAVL
jgi:orotidine-5'-phosphate decarboxylase